VFDAQALLDVMGWKQRAEHARDKVKHANQFHPKERSTMRKRRRAALAKFEQMEKVGSSHLLCTRWPHNHCCMHWPRTTPHGTPHVVTIFFTLLPYRMLCHDLAHSLLPLLLTTTTTHHHCHHHYHCHHHSPPLTTTTTTTITATTTSHRTKH
jgi:hypothetical protein